MSTIDFDMDFEDNEQAMADRRLLIKFSIVPTHCEFESQQQGRPIYRDEEVIQIMQPGDRSVHSAMVDESYRQRFARQYAKFKAGLEQTETTGTPLSALLWLTPSQQAEFAALNVKTVEQLANIPDAVMHKFMGAHALKQRAQAYLAVAKENAPVIAMQEQLQQRDDQIKVLQDQMAQLQDALVKQQKVPVKA